MHMVCYGMATSMSSKTQTTYIRLITLIAVSNNNFALTDMPACSTRSYMHAKLLISVYAVRSYRAATFASQNDVKWCHHNFRGAIDIEISMA